MVAETAEVFRVNAEADAQRGQDAFAMAMQQYGAEFRVVRRGWFDQLIDGINRLPRPLMAFGTLGLFGAAMFDPVWFAARMVGLQAVPEPLWYILAGVVAFYFGARELHHHRNMRIADPGQVASTLRAVREIEALDAAPEPVGPAGAEGDGNPVLDEFLNRKDTP